MNESEMDFAQESVERNIRRLLKPATPDVRTSVLAVVRGDAAPRRASRFRPVDLLLGGLGAAAACLLFTWLLQRGKTESDRTSKPPDVVQKPIKPDRTFGPPAPSPAVVGWRADTTGVVPNAEPPTEWSDKTNVVWKQKVGTGHSSPIAIGDKVFVLSEPNTLHCVNAADGKIDWIKPTSVKDLSEADQRKAIEGVFQSGLAASTPVSDGTNVFIVLANGMVAAYEIQTGNRVWIKVIDTQPVSMEGRSASPILVDGKLVVHLTDLFALDPKTGLEVWRQSDASQTYGSPCLGKIGDVWVIGTGSGCLVRASDGKLLARDIGSAMYASPVIMDGYFYMIGGNFTIAKLPEKIEGDRAAVKEVWSDSLEGDAYGSPVVHDGLVYTCTEHGKYTILDPMNKAKVEFAGGMGGEEGGAVVWGSATLAGSHIFVSDTAGKTMVFELGKKGKAVGTNKILEGSGATPAFSGKRIYIRGGEFLYCLAK